MIIVVEPFDGRVFEGSVHSLDLAIGPGMPWLSKAMIDGIHCCGVKSASNSTYWASKSLSYFFRCSMSAGKRFARVARALRQGSTPGISFGGTIDLLWAKLLMSRAKA